ncbi:MAG: hypothetical protein V7K26_24100 [Nostoc sp.]
MKNLFGWETIADLFAYIIKNCDRVERPLEGAIASYLVPQHCQTR